MRSPFRKFSVHRDATSGMVLVIMLAMIVLVTIAVMAFFTHATANRQVETGRANKIKAEILAQTGSEYVTGLLLREASGGSVLPSREISAAIAPTSADFINLIRQSVNVSSSVGDTNASVDGTAQVSRNGRFVSPARWNMPMLLNGQGFTSTNQLPGWIYVTRTGGLTSSPGADVIGRFAYNMYDIGGLLDANVAGFGTNVSAATNISTLKSSAAGADLTQLGLSDSAINALVAFRDSGAAGGSEGDYMDRISASQEAGFLRSLVTNSANSNQVYTNNYFTSRQDLVRYARTQNPGLTNSLPYLTHFSRSLSAPSWKPGSPSPQDPDLSTLTFPVGGEVTHYNDDGTSFKYSVKAGDPALQRKFSLAKLAWLGPDGPNASAFDSGLSSDQRNAAILACFGLVWDTTYERWNYQMEGKDSSKPDSYEGYQILNDVAAALREPNFFELLNAGIDRQSLGFNFETTQGTTNATPTEFSPQTNVQSQQWHEYWCYIGSQGTKDILANRELQILRIGACMVDSADDDNYPTVMSFPISGFSVEQAGVEDLPYLYSIMVQGLCDVEGLTKSSSGRLYNQDIIWVPVFINPHRISPNPAPNSKSPDFVRMQFASGALTRADINGAGAIFPQVLPSPRSFSQLSEASGQGPIDIPRSQFESFRLGPQVMTQEISPAGDGGNNDLGTLVSYTDPTGQVLSNISAELATVQGFRIFSWQRDYTGSAWQPATATKQRYLTASSSWANNGYAPFLYFNDVNAVMRYKTPTGSVWRTYQTLGGSANYAGSGLNGARQDGVSSPTQVMRSGRHFNDTLPCHDLSLTYHIASPDPRTSRGGPFSARAWSFASPFVQMPQITVYSVKKKSSGAPMGFFPEAGKDAAGTRSDYSATQYIPTNFRDGDSIYRPADGYLKTASDNANPYRHVASDQLLPSDITRPVILQRPFHSAAELGYVFRDQMWKTLSFFDASSADAALLDIFSTSDAPPFEAGRVSLNTRQKAVLQSLLAGNTLDPEGASVIDSDNAEDIAEAIQSYTFSGGVPTANVLAGTPALASFMSSGALTNSANAISSDLVKYRREVVPRSLAGATQTRTWNVLIDVVAQVGKFPAGASVAAGNFVVDGEDRKWFSVAVDRITGEIVDILPENVNE